MTTLQAQRTAHLVLIATFLLSLLSIGHLTWSETTRLGIVVAGLVWAFFYYRVKLEHTAPEPSSARYVAAFILGLTVAFTITQFDPATSSIGQREDLPHFSAAYLLGTVCAVSLLIITLLSPARQGLRFGQWDRLDKVVLGVIGGVFVVSVVSQQIATDQLDSDAVFGAMKTLSYGFIWLGVTRLYRLPWEPSGSGFKGVILERWRGILVAVLILFVPALVYGIGRVGLVLYHFDQGQEAYTREDYDAAKSHYKKAEAWNNTARIESLSDRYLADLATLYFREGNTAEGNRAIGTIRQHTVDLAEWNIKVGDIYVRAGNWSLAVAYYGWAVAARGRDVSTLDKLGRAHFEVGDSRSFLRLCKAHDYVPRIGAASFSEMIFVGNAHFYVGHFGDALDYYNQAALIRPEDSYAIYKVGRAQMALDQFRKAILSFEQALRLKVDFADASYRIGECLEAQGDTAGALEKYEATVAVLPSHLEGAAATRRLGGLRQLKEVR